MDMAIEELNGRPRWQYYERFQDNNECALKPSIKTPILTGVKTQFSDQSGTWKGKVHE